MAKDNGCSKSLSLIDTVQFGPMQPGDEGFVYRSWLKGWRGSKRAREMSADAYYAWMHRNVEKIIDRGGITVCRGKEDPEYLVGWLASGLVGNINDAYVLHAAYTRLSCRGERIFTHLLNHDLQARNIDPKRYVYTMEGNRWHRDVLARWGFGFVDVW